MPAAKRNGFRPGMPVHTPSEEHRCGQTIGSVCALASTQPFVRVHFPNWLSVAPVYSFFRPPQYPACQAGLASPNPSVEGLNRGRGGPTSRPSKVRPTEPVPLRGWPWFLTGGIGLPIVCPHLAMRDVLFARCVATLFKCCLNAVVMALQWCCNEVKA